MPKITRHKNVSSERRKKGKYSQHTGSSGDDYRKRVHSGDESAKKRRLTG